jgi:predicted dehydrogenase
VTPYQRVQILGTNGRIEVQIPVNAPHDQPCKIFLDDGSDLTGRAIEVLEFAPSDQYTLQGDLFSQAVREDKEPAIPLEESIKNMAVVEAIFRSAKSGKWEHPSLGPGAGI